MTWKNTGHVDFGTEFLRDTGTETLETNITGTVPGKAGRIEFFFLDPGLVSQSITVQLKQ